MPAKNKNVIQHLNLMNFDENIKQGIALVDFWAPWCQPCLDQNSVLEEIAKEIESDANVFKVDVSDNLVISKQEGVTNIPLLILYQRGKVVGRYQGIQSKDIIIKAIYNLIEKL